MLIFLLLSWILLRLPGKTGGSICCHACSCSFPADLWPHKLSDQQERHFAGSSASAFPDPCTFITLQLSTHQPIRILYRKMPVFQKHLKHGHSSIVQQKTSVVFLIFFFSFHRFWGPVWRWWHPVTNQTPWWWMIFTEVVFFFGGNQTSHLLSNGIQFPFIVILVSGFFKTSVKLVIGSRCWEILKIPEIPSYMVCSNYEPVSCSGVWLFLDCIVGFSVLENTCSEHNYTYDGQRLHVLSLLNMLQLFIWWMMVCWTYFSNI